MMEHSESVANILPAMLKVQEKLQPVVKEVAGYNYKYADIEAVMEMLRPLLINNNLIPMQSTEERAEGKWVRRTTLFHVSGEFFSFVYPLSPADDSPQAWGGANTYSGRYSIIALFCIVTRGEDDDGASNVPKPKDKFKELVSQDNEDPFAPDQELFADEPKTKPCNKCGAPVWFRKNEDSGKWDVLNPKGDLHYKTCRK